MTASATLQKDFALQFFWTSLREKNAVLQKDFALQFFWTSLRENNAEEMKKLVSEDFHCQARWNSGKEVIWDNIHEMVGAFKVIPWAAKCEKFQVEWLEEGVLKSLHHETLDRIGATTAKIQSVWEFAFAENNLISSVHIVSTVSAL